MTASVKESSLELVGWLVLAPLYAAAIVFSLLMILNVPLMVEILFDPNVSVKTLHFWIGVCIVTGGAFLLAVVPAFFTGVAKIVIERVMDNPRYRSRIMYGVVVPLSTLAWFYYLMVFPRDFSFTGSYWGRPAYSWMGIFVGMGLVCCWLMLRRESTRHDATKSGLI